MDIPLGSEYVNIAHSWRKESSRQSTLGVTIKLFWFELLLHGSCRTLGRHTNMTAPLHVVTPTFYSNSDLGSSGISDWETRADLLWSFTGHQGSWPPAEQSMCTLLTSSSHDMSLFGNLSPRTPVLSSFPTEEPDENSLPELGRLYGHQRSVAALTFVAGGAGSEAGRTGSVSWWEKGFCRASFELVDR